MGIFGKSAAQKRIDEMVDKVVALNKTIADNTESFKRLLGQKLRVGAALNEALEERDEARKALAEIAAMETASSAHIGRKMAARARRELVKFPVRAAMEADKVKCAGLTGH